MILRRDISASTADAYGRRWAAFEQFCADNNWCALPSSPGAVVCFFGTLEKRSLEPSTVRGYLTSINSRNGAAGFRKPAVGALMARLRRGYARVRADAGDAFPFSRGLLPAPVRWRCAPPTPSGAGASRRWWWRSWWPAGRPRCSSCSDKTFTCALTGASTSKCAGLRAGRRVLAYVVPPSRRAEPDLPLLLLRRMLRELDAARAPPNLLVFSTPGMDRPPTCSDLTAWLGVALDRLRVLPPPGGLWTSYSCRAGGATALAVAGLHRVAIAQMLGHARNDPATANAHYVDALAVPSLEALRLADRWAPAAPLSAAALGLPADRAPAS